MQRNRQHARHTLGRLEMMEAQMWDEGLKYIKDDRFHQDFAFQVWMLGSGA